MIIKWYGTASIGIESNNTRILFDPFIPMKGSMTETSAEDYIPYDTIFITHGHLDHIGSMKEISSQQDIYCTLTPAVSMLDDGIPKECLHILKPGDIIEKDNFTITVYKGKHIEFDRKLVLSTIINSSMLKNAGNLKKLASDNRNYDEASETVSYLIEGEGLSIFLMGSLALDEGITYPEGMDLLILPYQGSSRLLDHALEIIYKLKPKAVFLDHFDDTFPPISKYIDTSDIQDALEGIIPLTVPLHKFKYVI